jgi:hypothetical protein
METSWNFANAVIVVVLLFLAYCMVMKHGCPCLNHSELLIIRNWNGWIQNLHVLPIETYGRKSDICAAYYCLCPWIFPVSAFLFTFCLTVTLEPLQLYSLNATVVLEAFCHYIRFLPQWHWKQYRYIYFLTQSHWSNTDIFTFWHSDNGTIVIILTICHRDTWTIVIVFFYYYWRHNLVISDFAEIYV